MITDKYVVGTLWDRTETKPFLIDRANKIAYINESIAESDVSDICAFKDNSIISIIYPGKYTDMDRSNIPDDVRQHVANENYVVCITELL